MLFFLENNLYGMGTHVDRTHAGGRDIFQSADTYEIPAAQVDGMDVLAVREATLEAVQRVRGDGGPVFLEAMTYRFRGHSVADPTAYRDSAEVEAWRDRDPIALFGKLALEQGLLEDQDIDQLGVAVDETVAEAVRFAEESDEPPPEALFNHVYA